MPDVEMSVSKVEVKDLLSKVGEMQSTGLRLVQMHCTRLKEDEDNKLDIIYSFEKDNGLENLRLQVEQGQEVPSISGLYLHALLYENEIHDLFGVPVTNIAIDYKGKLYETAVKTPFNQSIKDTGGN